MKKRLQTEWISDLPDGQQDQLLEKALRQKLDAGYRKKWQQQLAEQGIERKTEAKVVTMKSRRRYLAIAAAIAVFLVAGWWIVFQNGGTNTQHIADQYLKETTGQAVQERMGENEEGDALWQQGKELYTQKEFRQTTTVLESLAAQKSLTPEQAFLLANAYLQITPPDFDKALIQLNAVEQMEVSAQTDTHEEVIEWMRALIFYKKGESEKAVEVFQRIIDREGWYAEKARGFIKK